MGKIRFIETVKDLLDESDAMHHCVASFAWRAVKGEVQLFHGDIDGQAVTIEVTCPSGKPLLGQVKGIANLEPDSRVRNVIASWLIDLNAFISDTYS